MKLSNQAIGALLMTLQKCLAEEVDIKELLSDWVLEAKEDEIFVVNPPTVREPNKKSDDFKFDLV
jgi:hypothetical protein